MLLHTRAGRRRRCTPASSRPEIARTSRLVSRLTGYAVQPNKAIVGRNAFAHESGHPPGRRAEGAHDLRDHGRDDRRAGRATRSCSASTPAATRCSQALEELGFEVDGQALNTAFKRFKEIADKKKQVTAMDLEALVTDELREEIAGLHARVVRRRGLVEAAAARDGRRRRCPTAGGAPARSPATARSTRSSARSTPPTGHRRASCASSASTRSPAARTRSARCRVVLELGGVTGAGPGRLHRHHRGGGPRLRARALERGRGAARSPTRRPTSPPRPPASPASRRRKRFSSSERVRVPGGSR